MPFFANDAAIGIVPYIQSGDNIPKVQEGIIPSSPHFFSFVSDIILCIFSFANTDINEPMRIPMSQ